MSKAIDLAVKLKAIFEELNSTTAAINEVMKESDHRNFQRDFMEGTSDISPFIFGSIFADTATATSKHFKVLLDVMYLKDLEDINGKGTWREKVKEQSNYRFSMDGLRLLRTQHPELDLTAAKSIVEAYAAGLFE